MGSRRRLPSSQTDPIAHRYDTMDRLQRRVLEANERRAKSLEDLANDPERQAKQQEYRDKKEEALRIKEELSKKLQEKMPILIDKLLNEAEKTSADWAMATLNAEIEEFKELDNKYFEISDNIRNKKIRYYDSLLIELSKINSEFLFVVPTSIFTQSKELRVCNLSTEQKLTLQEKFIGETDITNNKLFMETYAKHFPAFINKINNPDDAITACSIDPSAYKNIRESVLNSIWDSPKNPQKLVKSAPSVVKYISAEHLKILLKNHREVFIYAVAKCPEVLKRLPSDYFNHINPELFFKLSKVYKIDLAEIMYPYANHFINPDGSNAFKAYLENKYLNKANVRTIKNSDIENNTLTK